MQLSLSLKTAVTMLSTSIGLLVSSEAYAQYAFVTNNGAITITKYTCAAGPVVIPSNFNGHPVVEIGTGAFKSCSSVTRVEIPPGVLTIGQDAFRACSGMTNIIMPPGLRTIGEGAFANCSALKTVAIPESVATIPAFAFYSCTTLTNVALPKGVTGIQNFAFGACLALPSIALPETLTTIGAYSFSGLSSLTSILIPKSVTTLGVGAFSSCSSLASIEVQEGTTRFSSLDGVLFDKSALVLLQFPGGRGTDYTVPRGVFHITDAAFKGCAKIESISIPDTVKRLGDQAFFACASLKSVSFAGDAPTEGSSLFANSKNAIVFITAGATGWGQSYGERPVVIRNLRLTVGQLTGPERATHFSFNIASTNDVSFVVEACHDIESPIWVPIGTNTTTSGSATFVDSQRTNFIGRWYRVRSR